MSDLKKMASSVARSLGMAPAKKPVVVRLGKDGGELLPPAHLEHFPRSQHDGAARRWPFPAFLDNPNSTWLQTLKRVYAMELSFPYSISPEGGMTLFSIVRNARPKVVVETGTCLGVSATWIAAALAEAGDGAIMHCFDDFKPLTPVGGFEPGEQPRNRETFVRETLNAAGLGDRVKLHSGDSSAEIRHAAAEIEGDAKARGVSGPGWVQLAFIDGDHTPEGVWKDFLAIEPMLATGALVVLHDTFPAMTSWKGPRELMNTVHSRSAGTYQVLDLYLAPINYGLGVMRRVG